MISICNYLFEEDTYQSRRKRFEMLMAGRKSRGVNDQSLDPGAKVVSPSSGNPIAQEATRENGPSRVSGPSVISREKNEVAPGVTKVPFNKWPGAPKEEYDWSGAAKKAADAYQNR